MNYAFVSDSNIGLADKVVKEDGRYMLRGKR